MASEDRKERIQALRDRIAAARSEVEQADKKDEDASEERELELEAERSELAAKYTRELGAQGTHWDFVPCRGAVVAVRAPHYLTWQAYRDTGMPTNTEGIQNLIHGMETGSTRCLLHPSIPEFTKLCKEPGQTGLLDAAAVVIIRLASPAHGARAKK
jgi:hypothetical protein